MVDAREKSQSAILDGGLQARGSVSGGMQTPELHQSVSRLGCD